MAVIPPIVDDFDGPGVGEAFTNANHEWTLLTDEPIGEAVTATIVGGRAAQLEYPNDGDHLTLSLYQWETDDVFADGDDSSFYLRYYIRITEALTPEVAPLTDGQLVGFSVRDEGDGPFISGLINGDDLYFVFDDTLLGDVSSTDLLGTMVINQWYRVEQWMTESVTPGVWDVGMRVWTSADLDSDDPLDAIWTSDPATIAATGIPSSSSISRTSAATNGTYEVAAVSIGGAPRGPWTAPPPPTTATDPHIESFNSVASDVAVTTGNTSFHTGPDAAVMYLGYGVGSLHGSGVRIDPEATPAPVGVETWAGWNGSGLFATSGQKCTRFYFNPKVLPVGGVSLFWWQAPDSAGAPANFFPIGLGVGTTGVLTLQGTTVEATVDPVLNDIQLLTDTWYRVEITMQASDLPEYSYKYELSLWGGVDVETSDPAARQLLVTGYFTGTINWEMFGFHPDPFGGVATSSTVEIDEIAVDAFPPGPVAEYIERPGFQVWDGTQIQRLEVLGIWDGVSAYEEVEFAGRWDGVTIDPVDGGLADTMWLEPWLTNGAVGGPWTVTSGAPTSSGGELLTDSNAGDFDTFSRPGPTGDIWVGLRDVVINDNSSFTLKARLGAVDEYLALIWAGSLSDGRLQAEASGNSEILIGFAGISPGVHTLALVMSEEIMYAYIDGVQVITVPLTSTLVAALGSDVQISINNSTGVAVAMGAIRAENF